MGNLHQLITAILFLCLIQSCAPFSFNKCNVSVSCWYHPPACTANNQQKCLSGVEWRMVPQGMEIQLQAVVTDLIPNRPYYAAVGFSYNQKMGDDTVIECIQPLNRTGRMQVSFNDGTSNYDLPQASSVLLTNGSVTLIDGLLTCKAIFLMDRVYLVANESQFMIHDLDSQPYYMLFARGNADPWTLVKDIHSVNDNAQFPWITKRQIAFSRDNASIAFYSDSFQSAIERYWRYRIAVLHGVALLLAWWILGSSAILMARYFKPLFPRTKLLGTAVWFQLHRDMFLISLILQVTAVLFIFYQAGWVWYECSYMCTPKDFSKKMHAITGVIATILAVMQPFFAFARPSPDSKYRIFFNWIHWFIGMTAWGFASTTIVLSLPLGKTGLNDYYGHAPNYVVGGYILFFICINVVMEILSTHTVVRVEKSEPEKVHQFIVGPSGMALANLNGPSTEAALAPPLNTNAKLFFFFFHLLVSLGVCITITVMLVKILLSHSP